MPTQVTVYTDAAIFNAADASLVPSIEWCQENRYRYNVLEVCGALHSNYLGTCIDLTDNHCAWLCAWLKYRLDTWKDAPWSPELARVDDCIRHLMQAVLAERGIPWK